MCVKTENPLAQLHPQQHLVQDLQTMKPKREPPHLAITLVDFLCGASPLFCLFKAALSPS